MERVIQMTIDLECPDEAKLAIDTAVETYKQSKRQWTAEEISQAKDDALNIMLSLCESGYSIDWTHEIINEFGGCISVWLTGPNSTEDNPDCRNASGVLDKSIWNLWVGKCIALRRATKQKVPKFITDKAGECW